MTLLCEDGAATTPGATSYTCTKVGGGRVANRMTMLCEDGDPSEKISLVMNL